MDTWMCLSYGDGGSEFEDQGLVQEHRPFRAGNRGKEVRGQERHRLLAETVMRRTRVEFLTHLPFFYTFTDSSSYHSRLKNSAR